MMAEKDRRECKESKETHTESERERSLEDNRRRRRLIGGTRARNLDRRNLGVMDGDTHPIPCDWGLATLL